MAVTYVAQENQHQVLEWFGGSTVAVLVDAAASDGLLTVMRVSFVRGDAAPLHVHTREDECFIMLEGSGVFWSGDQRTVLEAGGVAFLPRALPHTFRITSEKADMLNICTPGGLEGFFRAAGHDLALPRPAGWEVTPATMAPAFAAHGGQILGPPKGEDE